MKWQKIKDSIMVIAIWFFAIAILYVAYLKARFILNR